MSDHLQDQREPQVRCDGRPHWALRFVRWFRDVRSISECREILWNELDRERDDSENLRAMVVVAGNAIYWRDKEIDRLRNALESQIEETKVQANISPNAESSNPTKEG